MQTQVCELRVVHNNQHAPRSHPVVSEPSHLSAYCSARHGCHLVVRSIETCMIDTNTLRCVYLPLPRLCDLSALRQVAWSSFSVTRCMQIFLVASLGPLHVVLIPPPTLPCFIPLSNSASHSAVQKPAMQVPCATSSQDGAVSWSALVLVGSGISATAVWMHLATASITNLQLNWLTLALALPDSR